MKWQLERGGIFGKGFQSHFGLSHTCREITPHSCPPRTWQLFIFCASAQTVSDFIISSSSYPTEFYSWAAPHGENFSQRLFRNHFGASMVTPYFVFRSCSSMNDFCFLENSTQGAAAWQSPAQQHLLSSEHLLECQWQFSHQCFVSKEVCNKTWHKIFFGIIESKTEFSIYKKMQLFSQEVSCKRNKPILLYQRV